LTVPPAARAPREIGSSSTSTNATPRCALIGPSSTVGGTAVLNTAATLDMPVTRVRTPVPRNGLHPRRIGHGLNHPPLPEQPLDEGDGSHTVGHRVVEAHNDARPFRRCTWNDQDFPQGTIVRQRSRHQ